MRNEWKSELTAAIKTYLDAEAVWRSNPLHFLSSGPDCSTEEGIKYTFQLDALQRAEAELWRLTDIEYDASDPLRAACWDWRFWKLMVRKCTWMQLHSGNTEWSKRTMKLLYESENTLMKLLSS